MFLLVVLALVAAACGDDDDAGDTTAATQATTTTTQATTTTEGQPFDTITPGVLTVGSTTTIEGVWGPVTVPGDQLPHPSWTKTL
jgi:ABC-type glycerol-3-phosphate transport system substrate-binding protein